MTKQIQIVLLVLVGVLLIGTQTPVLGQAELDPNQISGDVEFINVNPEIVELLETEGGQYYIGWLDVRASSVNPGLGYYNWSWNETAGGPSVLYEITVESSESGIKYYTDSKVYGSRWRWRYHFKEQTSPAVTPEPANDARLDFKECGALIKVSYVDTNGQPVAVTGGSLEALEPYGEWDTGYRRTQAELSTIDSGSTSAALLMRGDGERYRLKAMYSFGTDNESDKIQYMCDYYIAPRCDEVVELNCEIPIGGGELGRITGKLDILGEDERNDGNWNTSSVRAWNGPFKNSRNFRFSNTPASGEYLLPNMVPSSADPESPTYTMWGDLSFGYELEKQYYRLPWMYNVKVHAGETTDLGDMYVIDPGTIKGSVTVTGPKKNTAESCLRYLTDDVEQYDWDDDGDSNYEYIYHTAVGAYSAYYHGSGDSVYGGGAHTRTMFPASFSLADGVYSGNYSMRVGGVYAGTSEWASADLDLSFEYQEGQDYSKYRSSKVQIRNDGVPSRVIQPGKVYTQNHDYCVSEVRITYRSRAGSFYLPSVWGNGRLEGKNYKGVESRVSSWVNAQNGPFWKEDASDEGELVLCIPEGKYDLQPNVQSVNPNGTTSHTELPGIELEVGCQQRINISTSLQIDLHDLPRQTGKKMQTFSGDTRSDGNVTSIRYSFNGNPLKTYCTNCGVNRDFSIEEELQIGDNTIEIFAEDEYGNTASVEAVVGYTPEPVVFEGCQDVSAETYVGETVGVDWNIWTQGSCDHNPEIVCTKESGSQFSGGDTVVNCSVKDSCESEDSCSFTVSVSEKEFVQPPGGGGEQPECQEENIVPVARQSLSGGLLWPPNHKFVDVNFKAKAKNTCDGEADSRLNQDLHVVTEVWSDETEIPEPGDGSGMHAPDAKKEGRKLLVRSERRGTEDGRVYLFITRATNSNGGSTHACAATGVPHSMKTASKQSVRDQMKAAVAECQATGQAPVDFTRHGVSEELSGAGNGKKAKDKRKRKKKKRGKKRKGKKGKKKGKKK